MGKEQFLVDAARRGDIKAVAKLLELTIKKHGPLSSFRRSLNINWQDNNGYTALHHSCLNGHSNIVQLLLAHNAKPDMPDIRGSTPLFLASWAGYPDIVKMLLVNTPSSANPNEQTIENETPLHSAAQHGHNAVVVLLLSSGADPAIRNNSFQTALDLAAQFGRLEVVQTLLCIYPDLITPYRRCDGDKHIFTHTCLHLASRNGHKKVVESLLAAGVDVNILTHAGSALHEAALCGKKSVVVILLKAGIDVYATDGNGRTALETLTDYPPHVTYDIVAIINEFTTIAEKQLLRSNQEQLHVEDDSKSLPKRLFEKNGQRNKQANLIESAKLRKKQAHQNGLSHSLSSLDKCTTVPANYLKMKPIKAQKSVNNIEECKEPWRNYKPVYKQQGAFLQNSGNFSSASVPSRSYEYINLLQNVSSNETSTGSSNPTSNSSGSQYVEMSIPTPMPRTRRNGDYTNLAVKNSPEREWKNSVNTPTNGVDTNNNASKELRKVTHSPTPDYPPPTVSEAEHTILNYIQQPTLRKNDLEATDSPRTTCSFSSDHVEEFISDKPFAGLFKGSSLNLAQEHGDYRTSIATRDALRSPSMVRSVNQRRSLSKQRYSAAGEDFSASRVWAEIDTIFEHIGNEVSNVAEQEVPSLAVPEGVNVADQEMLQSLATEDIQYSLHMRKPEELLLYNNQKSESHWRHSPHSLIYGEIPYTVYYLGSTVIRQLKGTLSTRKSIQKLKIDENLPLNSSASDINLLENCNTSTKYLKANLQTRLKVEIAMSSNGVKFIDHEKKTTICLHDIENINCVCQDAEDLRYFAYITKEQELYYCHVFMVDNAEMAQEVILTLGQSFEVAYQLAMNAQSMPSNVGG